MKTPSILTRWDLVSVAVASLLAPAALAGPNRGPDSRNFPHLNLSRHQHGQEAVDHLGTGLPAVARAYGLDPFALRVMLTGDSTLAVDGTGRLHYWEPAVGAAGAVTAAPRVQALAPLTETFKLHSRPTAKRIIYLDFDGQDLSNTAWSAAYNGGNPIIAPAWSLDADPAFNDQERTTIQYIWQRVAEDYAPFDVDVTTELVSEDQITRTDANDEFYGTRALISPISSYFGLYGGIAYVGAFDTLGDFYKPALIFPENLGPNGESYIAEAISHEVGHNFGLSHDGSTTGCGATGTSPGGYYSGQGNWAPIMGVGYYVSIVQWSKGEYANANNLEDDLATIASYVGYRADDHGDTAATATVLPIGSQLSVSGVISSSSDVDVFSFSPGSSGPGGTGAVALQIDPDSRSANLDVLAELRDAAGNLVAVSNPVGALNASFNLTLPAGTYFVHVWGTGEGSASLTGYSAYASVGQYTLTGTVVSPGPQPPVAVATATPLKVAPGQSVTFDGNGSFDPDGGALVSYAWSFSDGASGTGAIVGKVFTLPGVYTATLTVTDNELVTASTTVSVQVNNPPVAGITVTPGTSGKTPYAVSFSGATSSDSDGTIVSYAWNFGNGTTGTGVNVSKTYTTAGTYNVVLTVTDNNGATASKTVVITVVANKAPVAAVAVSPGTTGTAPFAVSFSGAGSSDSDGTITSYAWSFGDGTTGSGVNVSKTYTTAGTFSAKLTVTDNNGATGTKTVTITVNPNPSTVLHVQTIGLTVQTTAGSKTVTSTVTVFNSNGLPVSGVTVSGRWSGIVSGPDSAVTDVNGRAVMVSPKTKSTGTETFSVTGVSRSGYTYNSALNVVSSASIAVP